jgi:AcrR family transcriptional regulator
MPTSRTARTARERVREEMTAEILAVARAHLADEGAAALSLRSVARDLELAPSALYRYFDGRDALLSALIMAAYESLAAASERAAEAAQRTDVGDAERWLAVPRAIRRWALERPHEWGLIFGTPVPGYQAPENTVEPYARVAAALFRQVAQANAAGRLRSDDKKRVASDELGAAVAPISDALFEDLPVVKVVDSVQAWTTLVGIVSLEIFGHWRNTILDPGTFFEATMRKVAEDLGLT